MRGRQEVGNAVEREEKRLRGLPAITSPQTDFTAGDRPALMNKVTNLSLIRQRQGTKEEKEGKG